MNPETQSPLPQHPAAPMPAQSPAWLGGRMYGFGTRKGTLSFDSTALTFTGADGVALMKYTPADVDFIQFAYGWMRVHPKTGKVTEIAFYNPGTVGFGLMGRAGQGYWAGRQMAGALTDAQWKTALSQHFKTSGDPNPRIISLMWGFVLWFMLGIFIFIVLSLICSLLGAQTNNTLIWVLVLIATVATLFVRWFIHRGKKAYTPTPIAH